MATGAMESSVHVEENRDHDKPIDREKVFFKTRRIHLGTT